MEPWGATPQAGAGPLASRKAQAGRVDFFFFSGCLPWPFSFLPIPDKSWGARIDSLHFYSPELQMSLQCKVGGVEETVSCGVLNCVIWFW